MELHVYAALQVDETKLSFLPNFKRNIFLQPKPTPLAKATQHKPFATKTCSIYISIDCILLLL